MTVFLGNLMEFYMWETPEKEVINSELFKLLIISHSSKSLKTSFFFVFHSREVNKQNDIRNIIAHN